MSDRKASSAVIQKEEWHILKARNYLALLLAMLLCTSAAYAASPFDDSLSDSPDAQKVLALQGMIVYNIGDKLDAAVKLYEQDKDSLLDAIQSGTLGEIPSQADYLWAIPLHGHRYVLCGPDGGDGFSCAVARGNELSAQKLDFLWHPEKAESLLDGFSTVDQSFFIFCNQIVSSFLYVKSGGEEFLIPYSARPDFLELENQEIYTPAQVQAAIEAGWPDNKFPLIFPIAGSRRLIVALLLALIVAAPVLTWRILKRQKRRAP